MADEEFISLCSLMLVTVAASVHSLSNAKKNDKKLRKRRKVWVKPWIRCRELHGAYHSLFNELMTVDKESFYSYVRMDFAAFEELLSMVEHDLTKQNTRMRQSVPARERLCIALRFLATGESLTSLHYQFRVGRKTVSDAVSDVCIAIYKHLKKVYLKMPETPDEWKIVAKRFDNRWNFPHCIGALDGKHIVIKNPGKSGSMYRNRMHTFSAVLMAVVDADYKFMYINIGAQDRMSDAGIVNNSHFFCAMQKQELGLPSPELLLGTDLILPYMVVADDAFPLTTNIMKPFSRRSTDISQRIFNYRLLRARRVVENAFGILSAKFRVLREPIALKLSTTRSIVLACVCLHNFLLERQMNKCDSSDTTSDDDIETDLTDVPKAFRSLAYMPGRVNVEGKIVRKKLAEYFMGEGAVDWQWGAFD